MDSATIVPSSPKTNDMLTAVASGHDPDGSAVTLAYQWTKNGSNIAGASGSTLDLSIPGRGDRGDLIAVIVTASDGSLQSDPLAADAVTVANTAPTASVSLSPDPAGTAGVVTATVTKADADPGDTVTVTYVWKVNGTPVQTTSNSASTTDTLDLSAAGNGDPGDTVSVEATPSDGTASGSLSQDSVAVVATALAFDGVNDYVTFGAAPGLDASTLTIETWFRWTGGGTGTSTGSGGVANAIPLVTKGRAEQETPATVNMNYFLGIDAAAGVLVGDFEDSADGTNHPVTGTTTVTTNAWHHAAATYDGTTWRLYLDGVLDKSLVVGAFSPEATSLQHAAIGSALTSTGVAAGFFAGTIDEVRIWSVARTGAQVRAGRDDEIGGPTAGLLGRWGLDEGAGTSAANSAGPVNGTLTNGPAWVTGYGFPQDASAPVGPTGLTAAPGDGSAAISWSANAEADLAGYDLYRSTSSPVATTGAPLNGTDLIRTTNFTDTGLVNGTQYFYALVAVDGANNRSPSAEASTTPAPNAVPTVALVAPADAATGLTTSPQLSATATDPEGQPVTVTFWGRPYASGVFAVAGSATVASGQTASIAWTDRGAGQRYEWYAVASDGVKTATSPTRTFDTASGADPVLVGAGDIADCARTQDEATGLVLRGVAGTVFTAGDNVYQDGLATEFANCYDPAWGAGGVKARTHPAPGNHDWNTGNLNGYLGYFGTNAGDPATGRSYYSYDVGPFWHVLVLDSECARVAGGCGATSAQLTWATTDLNGNLARNLIVVWHKPRYSSAGTNLAELQPFMDLAYRYGAEMILVGHDHVYERQAPMNAAGVADATNGVRLFTIGTGGAGLQSFGTTRATSEVRNSSTFGIMKFTLHESSFDWQFLPMAGQIFTDSGSQAVHASPDRAPTVTSVTISPASPTTAQTLTATVVASDPDNDSLTYAYQWTRNGVDIAGATGQTLNLGTAGNGDRGDQIRVRATASDGLLSSSPVTSSAVTVANSAPTATVSLAPSSPTTNQTLTATATRADADADQVTLTYVWTVDGVTVRTTSATTATTDSLDLSAAGNGDRDQVVAVSVSPSDGTAAGAPAGASATVANSPPTLASVAITETSATTATLLHALAGATADADNDTVTLTYQWTKNGVDIGGATGSTLDLSVAGNGDKGDAIRVRVTPNDGIGNGTPLTSSAVTIANSAPAATIAISPNPPDTNALVTATATRSDVDGDTVTLTFVWRVNGAVKKTTSNTASLTDTFDLAATGNGNAGDALSVQVTPSDGSLSG
ncbi:MAG: LamG-like jellyroll fold domain-containing protein, partial [Chloroflexota bacterium]